MTAAAIYETPMEVILRHQQRVPVNVHALAAELGLPVHLDATLGDNAGMIVRDANAPSGFAISVNRNDSPRRQRFTLAHEIAHYVLHADMIGDGITDSPLYRSRLSDDVERQANRLAAEILLPGKGVRVAYRTCRAVVPLAEKFDVSAEAMRIRLSELGIGA